MESRATVSSRDGATPSGPLTLTQQHAARGAAFLRAVPRHTGCAERPAVLAEAPGGQALRHVQVPGL